MASDAARRAEAAEEARLSVELERRHQAEFALQEAIKVLGVPSVLRRIASRLSAGDADEPEPPF